MTKNKNNVNTKITTKHLKIAIGICICLVSIFCVLNFGYVSGFIFWCVSFFLGSLFAYIFYILLFLYGLTFIIQKKFTIRNLNLLIIGCVIISLGVLAITTNQISIVDGKYLTFDTFRSVFIKSLNLNEFPKLRIDQSGGIIGYTLVAILNSCFTDLGTTIFSGILIGTGTILLLVRPITYLVRSLKEDKTDTSLNKKAFNEYTEEAKLLDLSSGISRDGLNDYTKEDEENNGTLIKSNIKDAKFDELDIETSNVEEDNSPFVTPITVVESNLPEDLFNEPTSETIQSDEVKKVLDSDEESLIPHVENAVNIDDYVGGELQKVKFKPRPNLFVGQSDLENELLNENKQTIEDNSFIKKQSESFVNNDFNDETTQETIINPEETTQQHFDNNTEFNDVKETTHSLFEDSTVNVVNPEPIKNDNSDVVQNLTDLDDQVQKQIQEQNELNKRLHKEEVPLKPISQPITNKEEHVEQVGPFKKMLKPYAKYQTTPVDLLDESKDNHETDQKNIDICEDRKAKINELLEDFKIGAQIVSYKIGPSVTRYDVETKRNYSVGGIDKYMNDVSVRLGGMQARFVPIIQGKTTSGIEIANAKRSMVAFKDVYEHLPRPKLGKLEVPFGVNISGDYISADLANFPHMLVCGTTGSGKSIYMHSIILSLIMRNSMDDLRLIMVDPKCVEFKKYEGIPHLLCPIITEPDEANAALTKLVDEMEERFRLFSEANVSDIKQYNEVCVEKGYQKLPFIIIIVDEFADLIDSNKAVAQPVSKLGAKARAAGIHMIIATQRPSTDVITGTIKANLAVRVALMTSSGVDSNVVLGEYGAEKLLGNGDMLVHCPLVSKTENTRVQGCFVSNGEIIRVVNYIKEKYPLVYDERFVGLVEKSRLEATDLGSIKTGGSVDDSSYDNVKEHIMRERENCSISYISNTFHFGFRRSSEIFNRLVAEGIIEKPEFSNSAKGAKVLVHSDAYRDPTKI